ncbi:MAG: 2,3,4,5-tetrahydropyridine-2,6-carboxylate N-succinyltransferase [SAR86 cluster bacterium]|jgi:2,3,4,5-tetrahydropyridine-2-carboxylate N-succinyltransferase|nr:MAG: 2,3,4,5-tetrahydropyridine-2,6-carboxylate N-succinyltransferase [SAR86 cluster bacterium]|tara:strand:+ start:10459 stop:11343 length:885 start_codon:yes stop_codon:yes gene_type:complete
MKLPIKASGQALMDSEGFLQIYFSKEGLSKSMEKNNSFTFDEVPDKNKEEKWSTNLEVHFIQDAPIEDIPTAYLKLHLLSWRLYKPNELNLENIFEVLPNLMWIEGIAHRIKDGFRMIDSIDKFPRMTDHVMPENVRIADTSRVRLGAYLGAGTTVMHEGFINFNAGTEGPNMIEGRISSGVFVGKDSDLGGGSSTMGTLSGGNEEKISIGQRCLLGANAGIGISLGDDCVVEAGLYITSGMKITLIEEEKIVKAIELSGKNNIIYFRDSVTGKLCAKSNEKKFKLNKTLHDNN